MLDKITFVIVNNLITPEALSAISGPYGMLISNLLKNNSMISVVQALSTSLPESAITDLEQILLDEGYVKTV